MFKARQKRVSVLVACLTALCAVFFAFVGIFSVPTTTTASAAQATETLNIYANKGVLSNTTITWTGTHFSFVNNKGSSTTAIRTSDSDHYRLYQNSNGSISTLNDETIIKIVITCTSNSYATACKNSFGSTATVSGSTVTITPTTATTSVSFSKATAQWRLNKIAVTYEEAGNCTECDYSNGYEYTTNNNGTHVKTGTCTVCETEKTINDKEACTYDEGVVTPPTTTENGYTTYTCEYCGYSYTDNEVPALSATKYTLSFSVPKGITAIPSVEIAENIEYELPTLENHNIYTFIGWTTAEYAATETKPASISTIELTEDTTVYALYAYIEDTRLVKDVKELAAGQQIIIAASGYNYALSTTQNTNNRAQTAITKGTDVLTSFGPEVQIITLEAGTKANTFAFNVGSGYLYAASSSSNHLKTGNKNDNASWAISITNTGIATIKAQGTYTRNWLRYNEQSSLFSCYESGQKDVSIYIKGSTFYMTSFPSIEGATVSVGENLKLNYKVSLSEVFADAVMYFTLGTKTVDVKGNVQNDGRYSFSLDIPPQAMGDEVSAVLKLGEIVLDQLDGYSIKQYAQNKLNAGDSSAELKQLLTDMLYYGEAAQYYMDYQTENLVTEGVENLGTPSTAVPTEEENVFALVNADVAEYPVYFKGANVEFGDVNKIIVKLSAYDENVSLTVNGEEVELNSATYKTEGILATGFATKYTFVLSYDGNVMQTLTYSVNAYAYRMKDHATMGNLAKALYNYGVSADAYAKTIA